MRFMGSRDLPGRRVSPEGQRSALPPAPRGAPQNSLLRPGVAGEGRKICNRVAIHQGWDDSALQTMEREATTSPPETLSIAPAPSSRATAARGHFSSSTAFADHDLPRNGTALADHDLPRWSEGLDPRCDLRPRLRSSPSLRLAARGLRAPPLPENRLCCSRETIRRGAPESGGRTSPRRASFTTPIEPFAPPCSSRPASASPA